MKKSIAFSLCLFCLTLSGLSQSNDEKKYYKRNGRLTTNVDRAVSVYQSYTNELGYDVKEKINLINGDTSFREIWNGDEPMGVWLLYGERLNYNFELEYLSEEELNRLDSLRSAGQTDTTGRSSIATPQQEQAFRIYVAENLNYLERAIDEEWEGKIKLVFIVDTLGNTENIRVEKKGFTCLDKESVRVVRSANLGPMLLDGKPVKVRFRFPVQFRLY
jgi:TonB family protein